MPVGLTKHELLNKQLVALRDAHGMAMTPVAPNVDKCVVLQTSVDVTLSQKTVLTPVVSHDIVSLLKYEHWKFVPFPTVAFTFTVRLI